MTIIRRTIFSNRHSIQVLIAALVLGAAATGVAAQPEPPGVTAVFDWFEYTGEDPVYEVIQPGPDEFLNPILAASGSEHGRAMTTTS